MNGNLYETALDEVWGLFGAHLDGARDGLVCVVSERPLGDAARAALASTAAALGYGRAGCTFASLRAGDTGADTDSGEGPADGAGILDAQALFLLVEGIDPACLVAADAAAAQALAAAYRCSIPTGTASRALGRTVVAFRSFPALLSGPQDKQRAWALLKKLPKFRER